MLPASQQLIAEHQSLRTALRRAVKQREQRDFEQVRTASARGSREGPRAKIVHAAQTLGAAGTAIATRIFTSAVSLGRWDAPYSH